MTDHTPTPWVIPAGPGNDFIVCEGNESERPGEILFVLRKPTGRRSASVDQQIGANTAFIVKACNAHEALVAACRAVVDVSCAGSDTISFLVELQLCATQCARALVEADEFETAHPAPDVTQTARGGDA